MVLQSLASLVCGFIDISRQPVKAKQLQSIHDDSGSSRSVIEDVAREGLSELRPLREACRCCVCLSGMKDGEDVRILPCTHRFHGHCIDRWFSGPRRRTCPMCRFTIDSGGDGAPRRWEELTEEMVIWFSSFHVAGF